MKENKEFEEFSIVMTTTEKRLCCLAWNHQQQKIDALNVELEKAKKHIESYCCCRSMGATGGQCCFCDDLKELGE